MVNTKSLTLLISALLVGMTMADSIIHAGAPHRSAASHSAVFGCGRRQDGHPAALPCTSSELMEQHIEERDVELGLHLVDRLHARTSSSFVSAPLRRSTELALRDLGGVYRRMIARGVEEEDSEEALSFVQRYADDLGLLTRAVAPLPLPIPHTKNATKVANKIKVAGLEAKLITDKDGNVITIDCRHAEKPDAGKVYGVTCERALVERGLLLHRRDVHTFASPAQRLRLPAPLKEGTLHARAPLGVGSGQALIDQAKKYNEEHEGNVTVTLNCRRDTINGNSQSNINEGDGVIQGVNCQRSLIRRHDPSPRTGALHARSPLAGDMNAEWLQQQKEQQEHEGNVTVTLNCRRDSINGNSQSNINEGDGVIQGVNCQRGLAELDLSVHRRDASSISLSASHGHGALQRRAPLVGESASQMLQTAKAQQQAENGPITVTLNCRRDNSINGNSQSNINQGDGVIQGVNCE